MSGAFWHLLKVSSVTMLASRPLQLSKSAQKSPPLLPRNFKEQALRPLPLKMSREGSEVFSSPKIIEKALFYNNSYKYKIFSTLLKIFLSARGILP